MRLTFIFDEKRCSGCLACVVACRDEHDIAAHLPAYRVVRGREDGPFAPGVSYTAQACLNCADAPCLDACPPQAIFRHEETGIVDVHRELCLGCQACAALCPCGAPTFAGDGLMAKCDSCRNRVAAGLEPACVQTCTTGALRFGPAS